MWNWIKSLFCKHEYVPCKDFRGFFGIGNCKKCNKWMRLPDDQMTHTHIKFPKIHL